MKYIIDTMTVSSAQNVDAGCNAIIFTNRGTNTALINGQPLLEGESMANNGLPGEMDTTRYSVRFSGAGTNELYIRRKLYVSANYKG
jgi:hypothetical protein